jgi:glycosyltransferase involved in cell wall biosynthesis
VKSIFKTKPTNESLMSEQHFYQARISPVPEEVSRPLWSVMIPTYNCADYLHQTLTSVLAQDPGVDIMQIMVIDDCSTKDEPEVVVEDLGKGRIEFYQKSQNFGYIRNFETCLSRSRGKLIHLLHGDDYVKDRFYQKMQLAFEKNPEIGAAFCRHVAVDEQDNQIWVSDLEQSESGVLRDSLDRLAVRQRIQAPSIVVRRDVYEKLGGFDRRFSCCGEDWEMWVRIAAEYPIWYEVEPLAVYRIHSKSLSRMSTRTGADMQDLRMAIEMMKPYLPEPIANQLSALAREHWAIFAIRDLAPKMLAMGDIAGAFTQTKEALKCSQSFKVLKESASLSLKISNQWIQQQLYQ